MNVIAPNLRVPVQPRSQRTRAAVVEAARTEFSKRGYADATASSIAARARVGTGTFYHYFPDKDAVLRELAQERVNALLSQTAPLTTSPSVEGDPAALIADARARLGRLVEVYVEYHRTDRGLHSVITERRSTDPALDDIMAASEREAVARTCASLVRWGHDGDAEAASVMMFSLLEGAVHGHVLGQAMVSDERFSRALVESLFRIAVPARWLALSPVIQMEKTE